MATNKGASRTDGTPSTPEESSGITIQAKSDRQVNLLEKNKKNLALAYRQEKQVAVSMSPMYAPYLGKVHRVGLNGISIFIPCDGRSYDIPKSFASELHRKRRSIDDVIMRQQRQGSVGDNFERSIGELTL